MQVFQQQYPGLDYPNLEDVREEINRTIGIANQEINMVSRISQRTFKPIKLNVQPAIAADKSTVSQFESIDFKKIVDGLIARTIGKTDLADVFGYDDD